MTKTFAVIGDPIDHSLSPNIHNAAFRKLDLDCTYIAYKIPRGELEAGLQSLKSIKIAGFNVTIPHKVEMMKYLDSVDRICSIIGATNTVTNDNGKLIGYNTDMDGFLDPIRKRNLTINDSKVLLLGAGGAARAIVTGFAREKAREITIANRTAENAQELVQFGHKIGIITKATTLELAGEAASEYDFIVNATPIGLTNKHSPISTKNINENSIVYDIVYKPINTELLKEAKNKGATLIFGYEMLLAQATRSFKVWLGIDAPHEAMKKALLGGF